MMKCEYSKCIWNKEDMCECGHALMIKTSDDKSKIVECSGYKDTTNPDIDEDIKATSLETFKRIIKP